MDIYLRENTPTLLAMENAYDVFRKTYKSKHDTGIFAERKPFFKMLGCKDLSLNGRTKFTKHFPAEAIQRIHAINGPYGEIYIKVWMIKHGPVEAENDAW